MKKHNDAPSEEPSAKRMKLLSDDEASDSDANDAAKLSINQDFAKRFEHNKKREERQRRESSPSNHHPITD